MKVAILYDAAAEAADASPDVQGVLEAVDAVEGALRLGGFTSTRVRVDALESEAWRREIGDADLVFNLCENVAGVSAAEVAVARAIESAGLALTGASADALALARRKDLANARLEQHGLPVPDWTVVDGAFDPEDWSHWPAIVKPAGEDASVGISQTSIAQDPAELAAAIDEARPYGTLIVQRYVEGRELNVGVVGARVLPIAEIDFSAMPAGAWHAVTYAAKWEYGSDEDTGTTPRCPAELEPALRERVTAIARRAVRALGVDGYARVDLRVDARGEPWILEVNPNPDLAPSAGLARMGRAAGWSYAQLVGHVVEDAVADPRDARLGEIDGGHRGTIESILRSTGVFREEEIEIGLEVLESYLGKPGQDYDAVGAFTRDGSLLGYACWGATPCTRGTYDLYWIAVSPDAQGRGVGRLIMQEVERRLARAEARLVLIETSSTEPYAPTRAFYRSLGYQEVARVPDFYLDGDDRVILAKRLDRRDEHDNAVNERER